MCNNFSRERYFALYLFIHDTLANKTTKQKLKQHRLPSPCDAKVLGDMTIEASARRQNCFSFSLMVYGRVGFSPSVRNWVWTRSDVIGLSYLVKHLYDRQQTQLQIKVAPEEGETIPAKKYH